MIKMIVTGLVLAGTMLSAGGDIASVVPVSEEPRTKSYAGIGLNTATVFSQYDDFIVEDDLSTFSNMGVTAFVGYDAYRDGMFDLAVEGRVGQSMWRERDNDVSTSFISVLLVPEINFNDRRFGIYGAIGITGLMLDTEYCNQTVTATTYGVGGEYRFNNDVSVFVDYMYNASNKDINYFGDGIDVDVATLGLKVSY